MGQLFSVVFVLGHMTEPSADVPSYAEVGVDDGGGVFSLVAGRRCFRPVKRYYQPIVHHYNKINRGEILRETSWGRRKQIPLFRG